MQQEPLYSTLYIHSEGAMRGGGFFLEPRRHPTGLGIPSLAPCLCLFLLQLLELPFPLQLLTVPMLSSQPFSWGLRLQEPGQGFHTGALEAHFDVHPQNQYNLRIEASKN